MKSPFIDFIKGRRSIREFTTEIPSDADVMRIIEAAGYAPSPTNLQPWKFVVIRSLDIRTRMAEAVKQKIEFTASQAPESMKRMGKSSLAEKSYFERNFTFFQKAPVVIVPLYKPFPSHVYAHMGDAEELSRMGRELSIMSVSAAVENLLLAAHALGLGGCWMHGPLIAEEELKAILSIRPPWQILAVVPIGVPADVPEPTRRKRLDIITKFIE